MRRRVLALVIVLSAAALVAPASGDARLRYKLGVSDQLASTFTNPLYAGLHLSIARYITPWDVMLEKPTSFDRVALNAWIAAAQADHQDILVSFEHSHRRKLARKVPSSSQYRKSVRLFLKTFPFVRSISPWNEANRCQRVTRNGTVVGQPICHNPRAAARFYEIVHGLCRRCRIVGLDVLDQKNVGPTVSYIRRFLHFVRHRPKIWGFHDYSDTNRFSSSRTRAMLRATRRGDVWLTETGGIVRFGHAFPFNPKRAARALGCMFWIANHNRRIKRLYIYQFNPGGASFDFDAGLITAKNKKRPGWTVVRKRRSRACRR